MCAWRAGSTYGITSYVAIHPCMLETVCCDKVHGISLCKLSAHIVLDNVFTQLHVTYSSTPITVHV